jgi:hypothetical protein
MATTAGAQPLDRPGTAGVVTSLPGRALGHVLVLSAAASLGFSAFVLVGLDGWGYYRAPATLRSYMTAHRLLRPSGLAGHLFGVAGLVFMLVPVVYSLRKKIPRLRNVGTMKTWLEIHIFCGIVGPVFVTFHTSFKFNGIVSVAYWSMVAVVLSGFVGRYLYVRIPRSLRGIELTRAELDARADELSRQLASAALPEPVLARIAEFEQRAVPSADDSLGLSGLLTGDRRNRRALVALRGEIERGGVSPDLLRELEQLIAERANLLRQAAYLRKTKPLFDAWHVFHMPLVYVMFAIVVAHAAVTMYMGYLPFVP